MECQEEDKQRKEERMKPKMRAFHELPSTEIEKSGTIRKIINIQGFRPPSRHHFRKPQRDS